MMPGIEVPELKPREFARISELVYKRCGLDLRDGKERLVSSRLAKIMRKGGFPSFDAYYDHVLNDRSGDALVAMIDSLTTNHTSFFRELAHFEFLTKHVLPEYHRRDTLRIWSAACSTGEEAWTILISVLEALRGSARPAVEVRGTDISTRVLDTARRAVYTADKLAGVPPDVLARYFVKSRAGSELFWNVRPEIAARAHFDRLNLMESFSFSAAYPVIFCRNVMIYFDRETRVSLVRRLSGCLEPGGYLFVGHAESLIGAEHDLTYVRPAVYRKRRGGPGNRR